MKDIRLEKSSMSYIPTYEELGYTEAEMIKERDDQQMAFFEKEYDRRTLQFQERHREKVRNKEAIRKAKKDDKLLSHWFSTTDPVKLGQLIDESRKLADQVIDHLQSSEIKSYMRIYNEDLRLRVKHGIYSIKKANFDKLRRFPNYNPVNDSLYGSPYSFYRLWTHSFPSPKRMGSASQLST